MPLWPLVLLAGVLPAVASAIALWLYTQHMGVWCNPLVDDCVSISRMARTGIANPIFRAIVLPAAALQALMWILLAQTLITLGPVRRQALVMATIGFVAALALIVYGTFLGTEGDIYRWLRRRGTITFYGGSYIALLLFARMLQLLHERGQLDLPRAHWRTLLAMLGGIAALGLLHGFAALARMKALEDRIENLTEWWGSLFLSSAFVVVALLLRRWRLGAVLQVQPQRGST